MLFTKDQVVIYGLVKSGGKFCYRFTLIVYQVIYSFQFSKKYFVRFTICDRSDVSFIL